MLRMNMAEVIDFPEAPKIKLLERVEAPKGLSQVTDALLAKAQRLKTLIGQTSIVAQQLLPDPDEPNGLDYIGSLIDDAYQDIMDIKTTVDEARNLLVASKMDS